MKIKAASILLLFSITCSSQIVFEKYYGINGANNMGFYLQEVSNGYLISGSTDNFGIVIRTNVSGDSLWHKKYPNGTVESLRPSKNGTFVLGGTDYNPPYNGVFRQIDSIGNIIWDTITTSNPFTMYGIAGIQMADGNFALLENDNYPFQEFLRIRKISAISLDTLWTLEISKISGCSSSSMVLTNDSSIVVANGTFGTPYPRAIISKTRQDGTLAWKRDYYYPGDTGIAANSIAQTSDSGFIVVGYKVYGNPQSDYRLFLMKTNVNGISTWTKEYNLRNSNAFPDVIQTSDGGFAAIGTVVYPPQGGNFDYRIVMMKANSLGDSLWTREFTGYGLNEAKKIIQTGDGGFAIIGTSTNQNSNQTYLYLIKTDSLGKIIQSVLPCNPALTVTIQDYCNPDSNKVSIPAFGTLPNDYYWYGSTGNLIHSDTGLISGDSLFSLPSGDYFVVINDSGVCGIDTLSFSIPNPVDIVIDSTKHTSCIGCSDGKVYFTVTGGLPPYVISIPGGIVSGDSIYNLNQGSYLICVEDSNGCNSCEQVVILEDPVFPCNPTLTVTIHDFCNPDSNMVSIPAFGTLPNDYYWYDSTGNLFQSDTGMTSGDSMISLPPGNYFVVINDSGVCGVDTLSFSIPKPLDIVIDSLKHTTCIGCSDGRVYFTVSGGLPPYAINIPGGIVSGDSVYNLNQGSYLICVEDSNGCNSCEQAVILQDPAMISNEILKSEYVLFPNPVSGVTNLSFQGKGKTTIKILDINGKLMKTILNKFLDPGLHEVPVDCNDLSKGNYLIEVIEINKRTYFDLLIH